MKIASIPGKDSNNDSVKNHNENFRNSQTNDIHTNWKDMVAREREREKKNRWRCRSFKRHCGNGTERRYVSGRIGRTDKIDVDEDKIKTHTDAVEAKNERVVKAKDADIEEDDVVRWPTWTDDNMILTRWLNSLEENGDIRLSSRFFFFPFHMHGS